jgi:hypothetical protein
MERQLDVLFQTYVLNSRGVAKAEAIATVFDDLLAKVAALCPAGRELSIVRTKLEEACFYAKKSMASDPTNQVTEDK